MRLIPKNTKVKTRLYRSVTFADVILGVSILAICALIVSTNLPHKFIVALGVVCLMSPLFLSLSDERIYVTLLYMFKHLFGRKRYGSSAEHTESFAVVDTTAPIIDVTGDYADALAESEIALLLPNITDNYDGTISAYTVTVLNSLDADVTSSVYDPIEKTLVFAVGGTYKIVYTAVDSSGNRAAEVAKTITVTGLNVTVSFASNGGSPVDPMVDVTSGSTIGAPAVPVKYGYLFTGWFKDAGLTDDWDFDNDMVTEDMTLYAKWALITFSVSIVDEDGKVTIIIKHVGESLTEADIPILEGYTFEGWYADSALTQAYDTSAEITGDMTVYIKWTAATGGCKSLVMDAPSVILAALLLLQRGLARSLPSC